MSKISERKQIVDVRISTAHSGHGEDDRHREARATVKKEQIKSD